MGEERLRHLGGRHARGRRGPGASPAFVHLITRQMLGLQMLRITYLLYRLGRMVIRMILKRAARRSANEGV